MANKRHTAEEILGKLRQADVVIGQGRTVAEACCELGVTEVTCFRWRKEYAGLKLDQARLLNELEKENARYVRLLLKNEKLGWQHHARPRDTPMPLKADESFSSASWLIP